MSDGAREIGHRCNTRPQSDADSRKRLESSTTCTTIGNLLNRGTVVLNRIGGLQRQALQGSSDFSRFWGFSFPSSPATKVIVHTTGAANMHFFLLRMVPVSFPTGLRSYVSCPDVYISPVIVRLRRSRNADGTENPRPLSANAIGSCTSGNKYSLDVPSLSWPTSSSSCNLGQEGPSSEDNRLKMVVGEKQVQNVVMQGPLRGPSQTLSERLLAGQTKDLHGGLGRRERGQKGHARALT